MTILEGCKLSNPFTDDNEYIDGADEGKSDLNRQGTAARKSFTATAIPSFSSLSALRIKFVGGVCGGVVVLGSINQISAAWSNYTLRGSSRSVWSDMPVSETRPHLLMDVFSAGEVQESQRNRDGSLPTR